MMTILLDSNNLAFYIGQNFTVTEDAIVFSNGLINTQYTTANTSQIQAEQPQSPVDFAWKWENDSWVCVNPEAVSAWEAQQIEQYNAQQSASRAAAYPTQSDPIYFQWQRGVKTEQEWLDAVAAIHTQYPYK